MNATTPPPRFVVHAYVNAHPGLAGFRGLQPDHPLAFVGTFTVAAASVEQAPEALWPVGNKMGADVAGKQWPAEVRSLSVGDVVKVVVEGGPFPAFSCESAGWQPREVQGNPMVTLEAPHCADGYQAEQRTVAS